MNVNPKTFVAVKWSDLKTSKNLTDFVQEEFDDSIITKAGLADTLQMMKDLGEEDYAPKLTNELAEVAKVVKAKGIQVIVL